MVENPRPWVKVIGGRRIAGNPGTVKGFGSRRPDQTKRLERESELWIRRMASASSRAEVTCWILVQAWAWGESGIESVTTTSSMGLRVIRSTAGPESTAWVA